METQELKKENSRTSKRTNSVNSKFSLREIFGQLKLAREEHWDFISDEEVFVLTKFLGQTNTSHLLGIPQSNISYRCKKYKEEKNNSSLEENTKDFDPITADPEELFKTSMEKMNGIVNSTLNTRDRLGAAKAMAEFSSNLQKENVFRERREFGTFVGEFIKSFLPNLQDRINKLILKWIMDREGQVITRDMQKPIIDLKEAFFQLFIRYEFFRTRIPTEYLEEQDDKEKVA